MERQPASSSYPAWLPNPLTEAYLQTVQPELTRRESMRSHYRDPLTWEDSTNVQRAHPAIIEAYSTQTARSPSNARFNRYADVLPYDKFRVQLQSGDYLNASWVKELNGGKWTVASQAPTERSAHAFLSMFLQPVIPPQSQPLASVPASNRLRTIVQLTPNVEGRMTKAFQYFPKVIGEEIIWPPSRGETSSPIRLKLVQVSKPEGEEEEPSWIHSVIELSYEDDESSKHLVRHLHFLGWPDHGVPESIRSLLHFMKFVEACNTDTTHADAALNPDPPIVVGCSAGVGRTGTYIALNSLFRAHNLNRPDTPKRTDQPAPTQSTADAPTANWTGMDLPPSPLGPLSTAIMQDKIAQEVDSLREQRPMMVQTAQQLRYIYQAFVAVTEFEAKIHQKAI